MGILSDIIQGVGTGLNWYQQQKQFDYDQALQQQMFEREDTAVQRRAADLQAAGLSQTLAAGSAAQTMSPIRAQVPGAGIGNQIAEAQALRTNLMRQEADISATQAQAKLLDMQRQKAEAEKKLTDLTYDAKALEVFPLKELFYSNQRIAPDNMYGIPTPPEGMRLRDFMVVNLLNSLTSQYQINKNNAEMSYSQATKSAQDALYATGLASQLNYDFDLTKSFGVRSKDDVDAVAEAIGRAVGFGESGTPYATAASQIFGKIFNSIMGVPGNSLRKIIK